MYTKNGLCELEKARVHFHFVSVFLLLSSSSIFFLLFLGFLGFLCKPCICNVRLVMFGTFQCTKNKMSWKVYCQSLICDSLMSIWPILSGKNDNSCPSLLSNVPFCPTSTIFWCFIFSQHKSHFSFNV